MPRSTLLRFAEKRLVERKGTQAPNRFIGRGNGGGCDDSRRGGHSRESRWSPQRAAPGVRAGPRVWGRRTTVSATAPRKTTFTRHRVRPEQQGRPGSLRRGERARGHRQRRARRGKARQGWAWQGTARLGGAQRGRGNTAGEWHSHGFDSRAPTPQRAARHGALGWARRGPVGHGSAEVVRRPTGRHSGSSPERPRRFDRPAI
jgi:hypothetical protein